MALLRRHNARDYCAEAARLSQTGNSAGSLAAGKPAGMSRCESVNTQAMVSCALGRIDSAADLLGQGYTMDPGSRDVVSGLYDLLNDPPMPGPDQPRAAALSS